MTVFEINRSDRVVIQVQEVVVRAPVTSLQPPPFAQPYWTPRYCSALKTSLHPQVRPHRMSITASAFD